MRFTDGPTVEVDTLIDSPPERVWELCTDLARMAEWGGQENLGGEWVSGKPRTKGSVFKGRNRHRAIGEWETKAFVIESDQPRAFAWAMSDVENPGATWRFDLTEEDGKTRLRQHVRIGPGFSGLSYAIQQNPGKEERIIERRLDEHRQNMTATLEGIKRAAEAS